MAKTILRKLATFLPPIIIFLIFLVIKPSTFGNPETIKLIFIQSIQVTIVAWGLLINIRIGNIDFSIGAEVSLAGIAGVILSQYLGVAGIVIGALVCVIITGLFKIFIIRLVKTNVMVCSIALTYIFASVSTIVSKKVNLSIPSEYTTLGKNVPQIIIYIIMGAIIYIINHYSMIGSRARAVGGNKAIAAAAGIKFDRVRASAIMIASLFMGVAAIVQISRGAGAAATNGLESLGTVFSSMMAVFIGMTLSAFADGTFGCISGALCFSILDVGLISANIPSTYKNCFIGIGLLAILGIFQISEGKQKEKIQRIQSMLRHKTVKND